MKRRNVFKLIYNLLKLIGPYIGYILLAIFLGVMGFISAINITVFASLVIAKYLGLAINISYEVLFIIIIISGILRGILRYFEQYFNHFTAFKLLALLRGIIFKKLRILAPAKLETKNKGEIISLIQADIEALEVFYAHTITPFLIAIIVSLISCIFISLITNLYFALICLLSYFIIGIIIPVIYYKFNHKNGSEYRRNLASFNEYYLDSIYGNYEIIALNKQEDRKNEINKKSDKLININKNLDNKNSLFKNITNTLIILLNLTIIIVGNVLYKNNIINSYEIIIAFVTLISSFGPVLALANLPNNLVMSFSAGNRMLDLLEEQPKVREKINSKEFEFENLKLKNVCFKYNDNDVLKDINLELNKKEIIGILGDSGSGKSTILKLLMRFYDVDSGDILLNDINIKDISFESLYNNINLFSQSTYLFTGSIYDNLIMAKPDASNDEIIEACRNASILEFIENLDDKFLTKITDLKDNLSSGEKQRLGLARVFLKKPKLLLLDEATSNIDSINEGIILKSLKKYKNDMSIIMISHRKSTLSICDKIYELKDGIIYGS